MTILTGTVRGRSDSFLSVIVTVVVNDSELRGSRSTVIVIN